MSDEGLLVVAGGAATLLAGVAYLAALILWDGWRARGGRLPWEK